MTNKKRYSLLNLAIISLFGLWLLTIALQVTTYHSDRSFVSVPGASFSVISTVRSGGHYVEPVGVNSAPSTTVVVPVSSSFGSMFNDYTSGDVAAVAALHRYSPSAAGLQVQHLASSRIVASYGGGAVGVASAGTSSSVAGGTGSGNVAVNTNYAISAANAHLLASNNITTSASRISGGVTTFDNDVQGPVMRRSATPGNPGEQLPIDGKKGLSASAILTVLAIGYAGMKKVVRRKHEGAVVAA